MSTAMSGPEKRWRMALPGSAQVTPPSTYMFPSMRCGGNTPGIAALASSAGTTGPRSWTTSRSEEHTSELQSHRDLHSFPTRRSSDLVHVHVPVDEVRWQYSRNRGAGEQRRHHRTAIVDDF